MALNNQNETYYHHLQHNSHLEEYIILLTKKRNEIFFYLKYFFYLVMIKNINFIPLRWSIVTNVPNAIIGTFMKTQLEDAGIPVLMFRSRSADIAEFSHNDFVPHDLLVPADRFQEARRLIDAAPGDNYGPRSWNEEYES